MTPPPMDWNPPIMMNARHFEKDSYPRMTDRFSRMEDNDYPTATARHFERDSYPRMTDRFSRVEDNDYPTATANCYM